MVAALRKPTPTQLAALRRKLGDKLCWRLNKTAPRSEAEAAEQRAARHAADALVKSTRADMDARRYTLLLLDDEYQRLRAAYRSACTARDETSHGLIRPIEVGTIENAGAFTMMREAASGYSWDEVIAKVESKA